MTRTPVVVLVVGPPRSGTSAISGALNAAGVNFGNPDHFLNPELAEHNPVFFELKQLNALNDRIFSLFGTEFTKSFPVTEDMLDRDDIRALEDEMAEFLVDEFGKAPALVGLKDPRFCYTAPVWIRVFDRLNWTAKIVYVQRSAEECIRSNHKVNPRLSAQQLATLWVECTLAPAYLLREHSVHEVDYNAIMAGDLTSLARPLNELEISSDAQAAAAGFFDLSHRHVKDVPTPENPYVQHVERLAAEGGDLSGEYERYLEFRSLGAASRARGAPGVVGDVATDDLHAQLYYGRDTFFTESRSVFHAVTQGHGETITFDAFRAEAGSLCLRLDPMRTPGIVDIQDVRIFADDELLLGPDDLSRLSAGGTALLSWRDGVGHLLCWGANPQLLFPELSLPESVSIRVEVRMVCDNSPETVRRVPQEGFALCASRQGALEVSQQVLAGQLETMHNSLSWRITAPLRRAYDVMAARKHKAETGVAAFDYQEWIRVNEPSACDRERIHEQPDTPPLDILHVDTSDTSALVDAVAGAASEFCVLSGSHVEMADHALFMIRKEIQRCPDAVLIYTDEDCLSDDGNRHSPFFKPDWNPDLFLSQNYFGPLLVIRRSLVLEWEPSAGETFRDLLFAITERTAAHQIRHIPHVLYHCTGTSPSREHSESERAAIERALDRRGVKGTLTSREGQGWRISYQPTQEPQVDIILPTHNQERLLRKCIDSVLAKTTYPNYRITIVDNRSDDAATLQYLGELAADERISILRDDRPFNYSALNNRAVKEGNGEFLLFLNNDTEVITPEWLSEIVALGMRPQTGAVGAKLLYPDRTVQHGGVVVGMGIAAGHAFLKLPQDDGGYFGRLHFNSNYSAVTAACMGLRRERFDEIGGFNEQQLAVAFNDIDLCLRLQKRGYWNVFTPNAVLYHYESASRQDDAAGEGRTRLSGEVRYMSEVWGETLTQDPAYSPNLNLDASAPTFAPTLNTRTTKPWRQL